VSRIDIDYVLGEGTAAGLADFIREEAGAPPPGQPLTAALRAARDRPGASVRGLAGEVGRHSAAKPRRRHHSPAELREALGMDEETYSRMLREEVGPCR